MAYKLIYNGTADGVVSVGPTGVHYAFGSYWIIQMNFDGGSDFPVSIFRCDPITGQVTAHLTKYPLNRTTGPIPIPVGSTATHVIFWCQFFGAGAHNWAYKIDPTTFPAAASLTQSGDLGNLGTCSGTFKGGTTPDNQVWCRMGANVKRFNPATMLITASVLTGINTVYDPVNGFVWAGSIAGADKIDPATNLVVDSIVYPGGTSGQDIYFAFGSLWVPDTNLGKILRYDPVSKTLLANIATGLSVNRISANKNHIAAETNAATIPLVFVNPKNNTVIQTGLNVIPAGGAQITGLAGATLNNSFIGINMNAIDATKKAWGYVWSPERPPSKIHLGSKKRMRSRF